MIVTVAGALSVRPLLTINCATKFLPDRRQRSAKQCRCSRERRCFRPERSVSPLIGQRILTGVSRGAAVQCYRCARRHVLCRSCVRRRRCTGGADGHCRGRAVFKAIVGDQLHHVTAEHIGYEGRIRDRGAGKCCCTASWFTGERPLERKWQVLADPCRFRSVEQCCRAGRSGLARHSPSVPQAVES